MHRRFAIIISAAAGIAWSALFVLSASAVLQAQETAETPPPRRLAPGVVTVIPPAPEEQETFTGPLELVDITQGMPQLNITPNYSPKTDTVYEQAQRVVLRRQIWNLEFAFKPIRMVNVDVPQPSGKMQRKLIWYMVYRVKNVGQQLSPTPVQDDFQHTLYTAEQAPAGSLWFFPHFVLSGKVLAGDKYETKEYLDRVIPVALDPILRREDPRTKLYNSVEITRVPIPPSDEQIDRSVWGVVTWEDVDPRIDFFSIYIQGLSNAFKYTDKAPGQREFAFKTLQLNFWRPGDTEHEHEGEFRYGVRIVSSPSEQDQIFRHYGIRERQDHRWIYR